MGRTRIPLVDYWEKIAFKDEGRPCCPNPSAYGSLEDPRFWEAYKAYSEEVGASERLAWEQICREASGGRISIVAHRKIEGTPGWYSENKLTPTLEPIPPTEFRGENALKIGPNRPVVLYYPNTTNIFNAPYQNPFVDIDEARLARLTTKAGTDVRVVNRSIAELRRALLQKQKDGATLTQESVEQLAREAGISRDQARKLHRAVFPLQKQGRRPRQK